MTYTPGSSFVTVKPGFTTSLNEPAMASAEEIIANVALIALCLS
jgi:hypothetical protein